MSGIFPVRNYPILPYCIFPTANVVFLTSFFFFAIECQHTLPITDFYHLCSQWEIGAFTNFSWCFKCLTTFVFHVFAVLFQCLFMLWIGLLFIFLAVVNKFVFVSSSLVGNTVLFLSCFILSLICNLIVLMFFLVYFVSFTSSKLC